MNQKLTYLLVFLSVFSITAQNKSFNKTLDSIQRLRTLSDNTDLDLEERFVFAKLASELSYKTGVDSTMLLSNQNLEFIYIKMANYEKVKEWGFKNLKLAQKLKDSIAMAKEYARLGYYYHVKQTQKDSVFYYYYKALKLYEKHNDIVNESVISLNLAALKKDEKDFVGAEINLIHSIDLLQTLPENEFNLDSFWIAYNTMGLISKNLKQYDEALDYYKKAKYVIENLSDNYESNLIININIAELYKENKEFDKSIAICHELLKDEDMHNKDPLSYAAVLNNLAYTRFIAKDSNNKEIISLFKKAYKISDSLDASYEISTIGNDLSEFYLHLGQKDTALRYLNRSYNVAKQIRENTEVLRSLKLLSQAKAGEAGKAHLYEYIQLNDSLLGEERAMRNKFARIQFETNEIAAENKILTKDKRLLFITAIALLASLLLLYFNFAQRAKNKDLVFEKQQQKANEDIYSLMLEQQAKLEEGRIKERHRISEELHDGILSKLFAIRISFDYLSSKINADEDSKQKHKESIKHLQNTELEIRNIAHELNNDILASRTDFTAIINQYLKDISELHLFEYHIKTKGQIYWEDIDDKLKVALYRIIQEAIQNIIKHAQANTVNVIFTLEKKTLSLTIEDDGIGFNPKDQNKGIGLKNMKARISKLNGKLIINSSPDKGTTVTATMPIIYV